jgi:hypothetical protein
VEKNRNANINLLRKPAGKSPSERYIRRMDNNTKMDLSKTGCENGRWTKRSQNTW